MRVTAQGYIYFLATTAPNAKKIKIGFSGNVQKRFCALNTASPVKLELIMKTSGTPQGEKALHKRFAAHRIKGEWFRAHNEIWDYIHDELDRLDAEIVPSKDNEWDVTCGLITA